MFSKFRRQYRKALVRITQAFKKAQFHIKRTLSRIVVYMNAQTKLTKLRLIQIYCNFLNEFNISGVKFDVARNVTRTISFVKFLFSTIFLYLLLRTIALGLMTSDDDGKSSRKITAIVNDLYLTGWLELFSIILITALIILFILRLIQPIRFSLKIQVLLLTSFVLYLFEKNVMKGFDFMESWLLPIDYFALLAFPPIIEFTLRIYYVLFKRKKKHSSLFIENHARKFNQSENSTRQRLITHIVKHVNQSHFDLSYSIGVVGDWGVGKTSFSLGLVEELEKSSGNIVVKFNPWLSTGKNSLIQEFIESLKEKLGPYERSLNTDLDNYLSTLVELESPLKTNFGHYFKSLTNETHSSKSEFHKVKNSISRIGKKVVIIIDDLDRLDKSEIIEVLKLIRNTGNFSNTVYISFYDKVFLLHAIQHFSKRNVQFQLDKFFDVEIPLAPFEGDDINNYIINNFFTKFAVNEEQYNLIIKQIGTSVFTQFREAKKFVSSLSINYTLYGRKLYLHDFFILEIIKVKYPFIPDWIWRNRNSIFREDGNPATKRLHEDDGTSVIKLLKEKEDSEFTKHFLASDDYVTINTLLKLLFPGTPVNDLYTIREVNFFDLYFYNSIPDSKTGISNWYTAIISGSYRDDPFFTQAFDSKKLEVISDSLLKNPMEFKRVTNENRGPIINLYSYLIDWSKGRISLDFLVKAFKLDDYPNQTSLFGQIIKNEDSHGKDILARTTFIATILRSYFYEPDTFKLTFANVQNLKDLNFELASEYFKKTDLVTIEALGILYNQLEEIDQDKRVVITKNALQAFKELVEKFPVGYLDLLVRSSMIPNHSLEFTFEPVTFPRLFDTVDGFKTFVLHANYPLYRKYNLIQYINQAKYDSQYFRYVFPIEEAEIKSMPAEFVAGWMNIPDAIKKKVKATENIYKIPLESSAWGRKEKYNDHIYNEAFKIQDGVIEMLITPENETKFWRLGLKLSRNHNIQTSVQPRHSDQQPDICLTIGEWNGKAWNFPERIQLEPVSFPEPRQPQHNDFSRDKTYNGGPLLMRISMTSQEGNYVTFEVFEGEKSFGRQGYKLDGYNYFRLSAWADERDFKLTIQMKKMINVDGTVVDARAVALGKK